MPHDFSAERPYYTFDSYIKRAFGRKLYRLALSAGTTCPNRDGTAGAGGCIFCAGGAGAFAQSPQLPVAEQIERAKARVSAKLRRAADGPSYIAYFQSYTGTYAPLPRLRALFTEAVMHPDIAALSVATRPDCLDEQRVSLLESLSRIRPVWVELGLQSANDGTARLCNRAYPTELFTAAAARLRRRGLPVVAHVILGLPGETRADMLATVDYLNRLRVDGVKFHLLHVLRGAQLARMPYTALTMDEYIGHLIACLRRLSPRIVVHRITGDGPKSDLLAPLWSADKKRVLNAIHQRLRAEGAYQGMDYTPV